MIFLAVRFLFVKVGQLDKCVLITTMHIVVMTEILKLA